MNSQQIVCLVLYVLCIGLALYGIYKDVQLKKKDKKLDDYRAVVIGNILNKAYREKAAESKGMTVQEFERSWKGF